MGNSKSSNNLVKIWHGAADTLNESDKKYVESKMVESECFYDYQINIDEMVNHMERGSLNLNQYLFKKGSKSDALFVVLRGTLDIYQGDKKIGVYNKGSVIGDSSLKKNVARTFTVRCSSAQCDLLRLTKANYEKLIAEYKHRLESRNFKTLLHVHFLQGIPPEVIHRIEGICEEKTFHEGHVIVKKDFKSKHTYIIKSGSVREENFNGNPDPTKHNQFYSFGEECILNDELCCYYNSTIVATEYTTCLVIDADKLKDIITESLLWKIQDHITVKLKELKRLRTDPEFILNPIIKTTTDEPVASRGLLSSFMRSSTPQPQSYAQKFLQNDPPVETKAMTEETKEELMRMMTETEQVSPKTTVTNVTAPEPWVICAYPFFDFNQPEAAKESPVVGEGDKKKKKKKKARADRTAA